MESTLEEQCSALGGLFHQIISELKNGTPLWEDLIVKALKLHSCLRTAISAVAGYLDAFQKIADAATNARGATKDIGTALTRICLRHRSMESRMKVLTSTIMERLITPLQDKLEEWKKTVIMLDKDHTKGYKKARSELKKRSTDTLRLQKKARKGKPGELANRVESSLADVSESRSCLEQTESRAVRAALIEHRSHFCHLVDCFQPVVDEEVGLLSEIGHIQEAAEALKASAVDPTSLPALGEELMEGLLAADRAVERPFTFRTPPSSPSSLGSRKSSVASISSLSSSSSGAKWQTSVSQLPELSVSEGEPSHRSSNPNPNSACWPNMADKIQFERAASAILTDRPHTISSGYERGHQRTPLSIHTFDGAQSQPSSPGAERSEAETRPPRKEPPAPPPIPQRASSLPQSHHSPAPYSGRVRASMENTETQGVYVNMSELAWMAASKAQEMTASLPPPPPQLSAHVPERDREYSTSESSIESSGYGSNDTVGVVMRKPPALVMGPKPPPPLRRTASISSHVGQQVKFEATSFAPPTGLHGDNCDPRDNFPPPPDFLLENSESRESRDMTRVADTVRALTALQHTPASPNLTRKMSSVTPRSVSLERRDSVISVLASRLSHPLSPRHLRRHSESVGRTGQKILESLNARLAMQSMHHRAVTDPALLRASLMEEIKQGTHLKKTGSVNDRSAPKIY